MGSIKGPPIDSSSGIRLRSSVMLKEVFLGLSLLICYGAGDPGAEPCLGLTLAELQALTSDFVDECNLNLGNSRYIWRWCGHFEAIHEENQWKNDGDGTLEDFLQRRV